MEGIDLKKQWMRFPDEWFDTLTFGDLKNGDEFIFLPQPDDNEDTGLKVTYKIFRKVNGNIEEIPCEKPTGLAIHIKTNTPMNVESDMPVIKVE